MAGDSPNTYTQDGFAPSAKHLITDVLVEVFLQCNLGEHKSEAGWGSIFPRPSIHSSPLILGRVCQSWRQVALSTPPLWSHLTIPEAWNSPVGLKGWLRRSASLPLHFSLRDRRGEEVFRRINRFSSTRSHDRIEALNILFANTHRWKRVHVFAIFELILPFLRSVNSGAPLLEIFQVHAESSWTEERRPVDRRVELDLPDSPRLTSLILPNPVVEMSMDDCIALLALCPNLEKATFAITNSNLLQRQDDIIGSKIRYLCLYAPCVSCRRNIGPFFDHLRLPNLIELDVSDMFQDTPGQSPWNHSPARVPGEIDIEGLELNGGRPRGRGPAVRPHGTSTQK